MNVKKHEGGFSLPQKITQELKNVKNVCLLGIDLRGHIHQIVVPSERFTPQLIKEGVGFDGSSYRLVGVEKSDYILIPDLDRYFIDDFRTDPALCFFCNMFETIHGRRPLEIDPRLIASKAENALKKFNIADTSMWGPEYEFYLFNEVKFEASERHAHYWIEAGERFFQNAYHAGAPFDRYRTFRDEAIKALQKVGIKVKYHHHEGGAMGQQEIEGLFNSLLATGDEAMLVKYILFNLAAKLGVFITFMPKPVYGHAGSGWHLHTYLLKNSKNVFYKEGAYANISDTALHYIGGILTHARALSAFTNASTNSFKRLVPGFEAPVALTFAKSNRSSAIRIPAYVIEPELTRIEYRPPDFMCNPYFAMASILMAGLDGVIRKIDPKKAGFGPFDVNVFEQENAEKLHFLPHDLGEALDALEEDHDFLLRESVFSEHLLNQWIKLKRDEIKVIATRPHPFEYVMYFDL